MRSPCARPTESRFNSVMPPIATNSKPTISSRRRGSRLMGKRSRKGVLLFLEAFRAIETRPSDAPRWISDSPTSERSPLANVPVRTELTRARRCQSKRRNTPNHRIIRHQKALVKSTQGLARPAPHGLTTAMSRHMRASSRLCIPEQRSSLVHSGPGAGGLGPGTPSKRSIALSKNLESGSERPSAYGWGRSQWPLAPCKKGPTQTSVSPRSWCSGATHRIRTDDLALTRRLLYRLS